MSETRYQRLVKRLKASTIPFAEFEWETRPNGDFGTVRPDFEIPSDDGSNEKCDRAFEGSVDLFKRTVTDLGNDVATVEGILTELFEDAWRLNTIQYETGEHLIHYEWVFQAEGDQLPDEPEVTTDGSAADDNGA